MTRFPSFKEVPESPLAPDTGIAIALGAQSFDRGVPVALYGSFQADAGFLAKCAGSLLMWVTVIVIGRDLPEVWVERAVPKVRPRLGSPEEGAAPSPTFRTGGHFNLDLRAHLGLPDGPGRYWLMASMGEHLTERVAFELL